MFLSVLLYIRAEICYSVVHLLCVSETVFIIVIEQILFHKKLCQKPLTAVR